MDVSAGGRNNDQCIRIGGKIQRDGRQINKRERNR